MKGFGLGEVQFMNVVIVPPAVNSDRLQSQPEPVACCSWTDRQASSPGPQLLADTDSDLSGGTVPVSDRARDVNLSWGKVEVI